MRQATPPISVDSQRRPIGRSLRPAASGPAHGRPPTAMNFPRVLQDALLWCRPHHPYENPHQFQRHRPMCQRVRHLHGCTDPRPLDALQQFRHDRRNDQPGPLISLDLACRRGGAGAPAPPGRVTGRASGADVRRLAIATGRTPPLLAPESECRSRRLSRG